jgi:hypothetical protein
MVERIETTNRGYADTFSAKYLTHRTDIDLRCLKLCHEPMKVGQCIHNRRAG